MKNDINLMPSTPQNQTKVIFLTIILLILLIASSILLPILRRNQLAAKSHTITQELMNNEDLNKEYYDLEKYSISLQRIKELSSIVNSKQSDILRLFDIVNSSISPLVNITDVSISGNILSLQGIAPNDEVIAHSVLTLQENEKVSSVRIQEIFLDKQSLKRIFDITCITFLNDYSISDIFNEELGSNQSELGGEED